MNNVSLLPFSNLIFAAENDFNFYQLSLDLEIYFQQSNLVVSQNAGHALPTNGDSTFNTIINYFNNPENKSFEFTTSQNINLKFFYEIGPPGSWFNQEIQGYDQNHTSIDSDGNLHITLRKEGNQFYSSRIISRDQLDFLKLEQNQVLSIIYEAKLPKTFDINQNLVSNVPVWPAFWLLGQEFWENNISWPSCAEIDIMEWTPVETGNFGQKYSNAIHWNQQDNGYYQHKFISYPYQFDNIDPSDSFNNYQVKIYKYQQTGKIEMYFNDIKVSEYNMNILNPNAEEIFSTSLDIQNSNFDYEKKNYGLITNIALGGNYTGNAQVPENFNFSEMIIRDIRFDTSDIDPPNEN